MTGVSRRPRDSACTVWNALAQGGHRTARRRRRPVVSAIGNGSGGEGSDPSPQGGSKRLGKGPALITVLVLVAGLLITGVLALVTATVNDRNESRLLQEQVDQAGTVVAAPSVPRDAPGDRSRDRNGHRRPDRPVQPGHLPYVGSGGPSPTWPCAVNKAVSGGARLGRNPEPDDQRAGAGSVQLVLNRTPRRASRSRGSRSGEPGRPLVCVARQGATARDLCGIPPSPHHHISLPRSSSFPNLNFALYLGEAYSSKTCWKPPPINCRSVAGRDDDDPVRQHGTDPGRHADPTARWEPVPPADADRHPRRCGPGHRRGGDDGATGPSAQVAEILAEEKSGSTASSRALPTRCSERSYRAHPGDPRGGDRHTVRGRPDVMEIGGDWFDVIASSDGGFVFVVGDVSGRGVQAAIVMASLHYATVPMRPKAINPIRSSRNCAHSSMSVGTDISPRSCAARSTRTGQARTVERGAPASAPGQPQERRFRGSGHRPTDWNGPRRQLPVDFVRYPMTAASLLHLRPGRTQGISCWSRARRSAGVGHPERTVARSGPLRSHRRPDIKGLGRRYRYPGAPMDH